MIRIAAVDDEMHVLERFERMVGKMEGLELCGLFETAEQLLSYLANHSLDAVFLDIEMPEINGLRLAERVLELNENIDIIFVTAFNQYAVEAFELAALDYVMKPLTEKRFEQTVKRLLKSISKATASYEKPFVQCFGDFEVFINGEVMSWKNTKAKEILAFLIHKKGIPVSWEKIAGAVWPEYDNEKAHTNFHATTYLLRKRLVEAGISQIIENSRGNYRIVPDRVNCDLYKLEKLIEDNSFKCEKDFQLLEKLELRGYMEESGYEWVYARAGELDGLCRRMMNILKR